MDAFGREPRGTKGRGGKGRGGGGGGGGGGGRRGGASNRPLTVRPDQNLIDILIKNLSSTRNSVKTLREGMAWYSVTLPSVE